MFFVVESGLMVYLDIQVGWVVLFDWGGVVYGVNIGNW